MWPIPSGRKHRLKDRKPRQDPRPLVRYISLMIRARGAGGDARPGRPAPTGGAWGHPAPWWAGHVSCSGQVQRAPRLSPGHGMRPGCLRRQATGEASL